MNRILLVCTLVSITSVSAWAQTVAGLGAISGVVQDASGSVVPDADVIVANESKGIRRTLSTNADGIFNAPALVPSSGYKVTVNKTGFAPYEQNEVTVLVGQNVDLQIALGVGTASTMVNVESTAPIVEDTKSDVSQVVNSRQILDLPINGRRVDSFVLLTPAVVPDGTFGLISFRGIAGGNNFLTDGNDTTDQFYNENAGRTRIASQISQDAVQEFQVISDNFSAEYGRASGGIVNTVTRSGTNDVHGTAFWFFRDQDFNARDRYATINPPEHRDQVGGTVGGAIVKNKLFYFFDYEKTLRNFPLIASLTSAPLFNPAGVFQTTDSSTGKPTCGAPATAAQCAAAINYVTTRNFGIVPRTVDQDLAFAKIDYRPTERSTFSFSGNYLDWLSPNGIQTQAVLNNGNGIGNNANSSVRDRWARSDWTFVVSPTVINEARIGYFKDRLYDSASPDFISPQVGTAQLTVAGVQYLGYATSYPRLNPSEQRFQGADNISISARQHTIKIGVDIAATEDYQNQLINQYGTYSYANTGTGASLVTAFTNFALDFSGNTTGAKHYSSYSQSFGNSIADTNIVDYGLYIQDQWRITPKFQLNLGVRYDFADVQQPPIFNPDYPQTGAIHTPTGDVAPRIGFAYDLNHSKTVLRGGYGLFYARFQSGLINTFFLNNNLYQKSITLTSAADISSTGPVFPDHLASTTKNPPAGTTDITFAAPNLKNPYTAQWNFAVDQEITPTLGLTVSYLGSTGFDLYSVRDLNVGPLSSTTVTYNILNSSKAVVGTYSTPVYLLANRIDKRYRRVNQVENGGKSYYDGLAVQLNKRFSKGFQAQVAYTWAHAIDFNQGGASNNIFFSSGPTSYYNGDYSSEKGSSALDVRHRAVINFVWQPVFSHASGWAGRYLASGWELSQITTLQSSPPTQATVSASGFAFPGAAFQGSLDGLGSVTRVPFEPVDNLDLDRIYRVDARVAKRIPVFGERVNMFLLFEVFNLFNTPYDTSRNTTQYILNAATASLTPVASYGYGNASQAFPDGTNARRAQIGLRLTF